MPAVGLGEERLRSDAQVPSLWVAALDALGIPSVSFGHPPQGMPEREPFGSFAWVAAMRLTWLGTRTEADAHRVRWRPKKRDERGAYSCGGWGPAILARSKARCLPSGRAFSCPRCAGSTGGLG
jgi:hypothetical protein